MIEKTVVREVQIAEMHRVWVALEMVCFKCFSLLVRMATATIALACPFPFSFAGAFLEMRFVLMPVGKGRENLKEIVLDSEDPPVKRKIILGRNPETGLDQNMENAIHVSRSHLEVIVEGDKVYLNAVARQDNVVSVDDVWLARGRQLFNVGQRVSLIGAYKLYNYELRVDDRPMPKRRKLEPPSDVIDMVDVNPPVTSSAKAGEAISLLTSSSKGSSPRAPSLASEAPKVNAIITNLLRQYECAICYETMACAVSINPCGDTFCFSCMQEWSVAHSTCPTCSSNFDLRQAIISRVTDNAVREILKDEKDQLTVWEERVADGIQKRKAFLDGKSVNNTAASSTSSSKPVTSNTAATTLQARAAPTQPPQHLQQQRQPPSFFFNNAGNVASRAGPSAGIVGGARETVVMIDDGPIRQPSRPFDMRRGVSNTSQEATAVVDLTAGSHILQPNRQGRLNNAFNDDVVILPQHQVCQRHYSKLLLETYLLAYCLIFSLRAAKHLQLDSVDRSGLHRLAV